MSIATHLYYEVEEITHKYYVQRYKNICALSPPIPYTNPIREEGSSSQAPRTPKVTAVTSFLSQPAVKREDGLDRSRIKRWMKDQRHQILALLEQAESQERDEQIKKLIDSSLKTLIAQVKPSVELYVSVAQAVHYRHIEPDTALERLKDTQSNLLIYFKQGNLLFHPDHFQAANKDLLTYWNKLFIDYRTFSKETRESLKKSDKLIETRLLDKQRHQPFFNRNDEAMLKLEKG